MKARIFGALVVILECAIVGCASEAVPAHTSEKPDPNPGSVTTGGGRRATAAGRHLGAP